MMKIPATILVVLVSTSMLFSQGKAELRIVASVDGAFQYGKSSSFDFGNMDGSLAGC